MASPHSRLTQGFRLIQKGAYELYIHPQIIWDMGVKTGIDWTQPKIGGHNPRQAVTNFWVLRAES